MRAKVIQPVILGAGALVLLLYLDEPVGLTVDLTFFIGLGAIAVVLAISMVFAVLTLHLLGLVITHLREMLE